MDPRFGGPQRRVLLVAEKLAHRGIETIVAVADGDRDTVCRMSKAGLSTIQLPLSRVRAAEPFTTGARWLVQVPGEVRCLVELIRRENVTIIHCNGLMHFQGSLAGRIAGSKVIWHMNDILLPRAVSRGLIRTVGRLAQRRVFSSRAVAQYCGISSINDEDILYPPVDAGLFNPNTVNAHQLRLLKQEMELDASLPTLVTVGHVNPLKGYKDLLAAVAWLDQHGHPVNCLIVGQILDSQIKYYQSLQQLVSTLNLGAFVRFAGARVDVPECLCLADVVVIPSHNEALGMAVLEAMAMARPVVATQVGGIPEAVRDGETGLLVAPCSPVELGSAVLSLLKEPKRAQKMGEAGRELVKTEFDVDRAVEKHERIYRTVASYS